MTTYHMTIVVSVDDDELATISDEAPLSADIGDWYGSDLLVAVEGGWAEIEHEEIVLIEEVDS